MPSDHVLALRALLWGFSRRRPRWGWCPAAAENFGGLLGHSHLADVVNLDDVATEYGDQRLGDAVTNSSTLHSHG